MDKQLLAELCAIDGISGREEAVRAYILEKLKTTANPHEVTVDNMGNVLVHLIGKNLPKHRLLLDAHMDEVGVIITAIQEDGRLAFDTVGGIDKQVLFGHRVRLRNQFGIIGGKAIHHCQGEEKTAIPSIESMAIDVGYTSAKEAANQFQCGDWGTFAKELTWLTDDIFTGKAVDDRVGCALLLSLAQSQPPYDIWLSFSVQEEVGLRGAGVAAAQIQPDIAIAIDATTAADTVGSSAETAVSRMGGGAVVSFADRATLYDPTLYQEIRKIADNLNIPNQTKNRIAGGNNAGAIQCSGFGTRMAAISLPCRYIHSDSCTGRWSDVEWMEQLLFALLERLPT